jgi:hypothetical protein
MTTDVEGAAGCGVRARGVEEGRCRALGRQTGPGDRPDGGGEPEDEGKNDPAEHASLPGMKKPAGTIRGGRNFEHHLRTEVYHLFSNTSSAKQ